MTRWTTTLTIATMITLSTVTTTGALGTAHAEASLPTLAPTPPDALRHQLVEHRGVTMSQLFTSREPGETTSYRKKTRAEFGKGTVRATDVRERGPSDPLRYLTFKGRLYCQGWICPAPKGKTWVLISENARTRPFLQSDGIDLASPETLKALLSTAIAKQPGGVYDHTRTTLYQGTLTFGRLYAISPAFRDQHHTAKPTGKYAKAKLSWQLWLGADRLTRRLKTSWSENSANA
ncbi:hypothetical protein ACU635_58850 [[Actinomadura] parvosata]|uniref:hypothetical protein n=1 Tax=[Actinomadura] parvosata TaxID=1955412 RepID=UPI00406D1F4F